VAARLPAPPRGTTRWRAGRGRRRCRGL